MPLEITVAQLLLSIGEKQTQIELLTEKVDNLTAENEAMKEALKNSVPVTFIDETPQGSDTPPGSTGE